MKRAVITAVVLLALAACYAAGAEDSEKFILCNPKVENHVCVRRSPRKTSEETGRLYCGDRVFTDGKIRNGYLHIFGITEDGEGWVHNGYIVDEPPLIEKCMATVAANGRVKARSRIGGRQVNWLDVCTDVQVYARTEEWAVTNRGFIRMKFLEVWYE